MPASPLAADDFAMPVEMVEVRAGRVLAVYRKPRRHAPLAVFIHGSCARMRNMQPWWQPRPPISAGSRIPPGLTVCQSPSSPSVSSPTSQPPVHCLCISTSHIVKLQPINALPFGKCRNTDDDDVNVRF